MRIAAAGAIILAVIVVALLLSIPHTKDVGQKAAATTATSTPAVTIHDVYSKGMHTITGSLITPTPCTDISADATVNAGASTSTQTIEVDISMPPDEGICLQVPESQTFSVTASAAKGSPIVVTVNGLVASTTLQ